MEDSNFASSSITIPKYRLRVKKWIIQWFPSQVMRLPNRLRIEFEPYTKLYCSGGRRGNSRPSRSKEIFDPYVVAQALLAFYFWRIRSPLENDHQMYSPYVVSALGVCPERWPKISENTAETAAGFFASVQDFTRIQLKNFTDAIEPQWVTKKAAKSWQRNSNKKSDSNTIWIMKAM